MAETNSTMTLSQPTERLPCRRAKRGRKESSGDILIEELFPDDMGYDADVEALQPDNYEEAESETEDAELPRRKFHSIDEELAARMKHLGRDDSGTSTPQTPVKPRGRKRRSLHEEVMQTRKGGSSDLEVIEIFDKSNPSPPRKRPKRILAGGTNQRSNGLESRSSSSRKQEQGDSQFDADDAMDIT